MHSAAVLPPAASTVEKFRSSMPEAYGRLFDPAEIREHAGLIAARGEALAHAGVWRGTQGGLVLCLVCDDRPGLLSLMSDALAAHALDVTGAQIYMRKRPGYAVEAIGLFWVRRDPSSELSRLIDPEESRSVAHVLSDLIVEQERASEQHRSGNAPSSTVAPQPVRVYYDTRSLRRGEVVLVVTAPDCPGLLLAITRSLFKKRAEIVASEVRTDAGVAHDRFTICGAFGTRLEPDTLADIQQEVLGALRRMVERKQA